jgi:hypothetical protein
VLQGIAALGGGSVRRVGGEQTPQTVAMELLNEIAQPGLRDLRIEFRGLKVAAVYPGRLPNVPAGMQQIVVGRYLPEGNDQQGEVVVTGRRGDEEVRYAAKVYLKDAEEGNSFIPRLWARAHLDHLLQQGPSEAIREEIIALSEEFHIITPYTSLLVLETDADRERFGVKRRYEMRDGERFFAQGRDNANYELLQQQMKRAGDWRLALRRQVLRHLATLGRNPQVFQQQVQMLDRLSRVDDYALPISSTASVYASYEKALGARGPASYDFNINGPLGGFGGGFGDDMLSAMEDTYLFESSGRFERESKDLAEDASEFLGEEAMSLGMGERDEDAAKQEDLADVMAAATEAEFTAPDAKSLFDLAPAEPGFAADLSLLTAESLSLYDRRNEFRKKQAYLGAKFVSSGGRYFDRSYGPDYVSWVNTVFPPLAAPPGKPAPAKTPEGWTPEAIALAKSLLRTESLWKMNGGIEVRRVADTFDPRWDRRSSHNQDLVLYSPSAWLTRTLDPEDHTIVEYCDAERRGAFSRAFLLGRERASLEQELQAPPLGLSD